MLAGSISKPLPGEPGVVTPQSMASKARKTGPKKGGKAMKVAVWADDIKEPELIGECVVNFDDALTKGEVDGELPCLGSELTYRLVDTPVQGREGQVLRRGLHGADLLLQREYDSATPLTNQAPPPRKNKPPIPGPMGASPQRPPARPGLPTSTSVSGMNLYIPPYQQGAAASQQPQRVSHSYSGPAPQLPQQQAPRPPTTHSYSTNSFAELGLPPQPMPQPHTQGRPQSMSANSLASQMGSMSLGPSSQRPGATPHQAATIGHGRPQSYMGQPPQQQQPSQNGGAAPWAPLMPQGQQQAPPLPRPVSSNDVNAWNPNDPRASTVPPRPHSSMHQTPPPASHHGHGRTGSQSHSLAPPGSYPSYTQTPEPPRTASPQPYGGYQSTPPASQPGSYSQPPSHSSYQQPPPQQSYPPQPPPSLSHQPSYTSTPPRQGSWPQQQPSQSGYQQSPQQQPLPQPYSVPPPSSSGSLPNTPHPQGGYPGNPPVPPPHRNSLPSHGGPPPSTTTGPYVPWHMQTQSSQPPPPPHPPQQQGSGYGNAPAPPAPAPPQRPGGGYYPSDELYSTPPAHQQHPPAHQTHQPPPPQPPQSMGYQSPPPQSHPPAPMPAFSPPAQHSQPQSNFQPNAQHQPQSNFQPNAPPLPPPRVPSPLPPTGGAAGSTNSDWRSYLAGLGSVSAAPVPPVGGAQGSNDWYSTPPPAVPSSIMQHAQAQSGYAPPQQQQW